jgi:uncharacterized protein
VLPVEAYAIEVAAARAGVSPPDGPASEMCAFLDETGACSIYPVRPVLCRTHGLPLRSRHTERARGALAIHDDVSVCALNFTARSPRPAEILDAETLLMLLVTVDRRFRARAGLPDDDARVPLAELAATLRARRA